MPQDSVGPLPQFDTQSSEDLSTPGVAPVQEGDAFTAASPSDLAGLINAPCRALDVEYKSWRNLRHLEDRAELARDIAALANHGGGYIVFGFREDTLAPEDNHPFWTNCTAEQVATIVRAFLDPPVQCEVVIEQSLIGNRHPIIRVPSHGIAPICVRLDGPVVGKARLVERGVYYTRKHGAAVQGKYVGVLLPKSDRIDMPQEWGPLIRRCVRQDRETLLAMIDAAIEGRKQVPSITRQLDAWHTAAHDAFLRLVPLSPVAEQLRTRHYALSYCFELVGQEMLEPAQLPELLRRSVFEVQPMFRGVLNMFDPPYRRAVQARFTVDPATGNDETDFLEVGWLRDRPPSETADFWRLSPRGFGTIVRDYSEDRSAQNHVLGTRPGTRFSPNVLAQEIGELVCHTRALAKHFSGVRRVWYRCEWWGLAGRELFDPDNAWAFRRPAADDHRLVKLQVPAASLAQAWPEAVAQIMAPLLRCFEPDLALDADWVRAQAAGWGKS
jgi:hypothetical protein